MKKTLRNKKGFTLAELLIVVAIIAVLVAIAIPIFNSQLEKARDATDAANVRSAYAEATADYLGASADTAATYKYKIDGKSTDQNWSQTNNTTMEIGGQQVTMVQGAKGVQVAFDTNGTATITMITEAPTKEGKQ